MPCEVVNYHGALECYNLVLSLIAITAVTTASK